MAKPKKPDEGKTIIDVAHPGKSAPAANSKSVILSNRPLLKDPMMVDEAAPSGNDDDSSLAKISNKSAAQPLTAPLLKTEEPEPAAAPPEKLSEEASSAPPEKPADPIKPADPEPAAEKPPKLTDSISSDEPQEQESDKPAEKPKPLEPPQDNVTDSVPDKDAEAAKPQTTQPADQKAEKSEQPPADSPEAKPAEAGTDEATAQPSDNDMAKKVEAETNKEVQRQAAIDKLTDSKKYYLPINAVEKRRSRRFVILGIILSLLLIVAWADIALDSGLIHFNGIKPPTHFFSN